MSIANRVQDSVFLWNSNRHEGALLNALIAVAATSRLRYPDRKTVRDREAFVQFLYAEKNPIQRVEYRGRLESIPDIFYKWLRCELVHEGTLPIDIEFVPDASPGAMMLRAGGAPTYTLQLSHSWTLYLLNAVTRAPENRDELAKVDWSQHPPSPHPHPSPHLPS